MQFSQYNFTGQRINPALIGTNSYASFDLLSRTQKTGGGFSINSNIASGSYPLVNASTGRSRAGVGISVMDDRSSGIFSTQQIALNYAVNIRLDRFHLLSFGMKGLFQSQQISLDGFYTGSQYVPDRGFDGSLSSNESSSDFRKSYSTFSSGIYWQQTDRVGKISAYWGASIFDFNKPNNSFLNGPAIPLNSTFVVHGGFEVYKERGWSVFPEILYTGSAGNHLVNIGGRTIFELNPVRNKLPDHLDLITKWVPGRSGIVGVQLHRENFSFGISYDFPLFVANPGNLGALEVGLSIKKLIKRKLKKQSTPSNKKTSAIKNGMVRLPSVKPKMKPDTVKKDSAKIIADEPNVVVQKIDSTQSEETKGIATVGKIISEPLLVEKITLRFHFEFNSVDLDDEAGDFLENLGTTLKEDGHLKVKITGHTDNIGHEKFNQRLSEKRAQTIRDFLLKKGIETLRMEIAGKGLTEPVTSNDTEEGRAKNRRVEILVYRVQ